MRQGVFHYDVYARSTVPAAMALLSDLTRQGELHPLIIGVRVLPPEPGALRSYAISDRLAWGPFRFKTTYYADVLAETGTSLHMVARQSPKVTVDNRTEIADQGDGTVHIRVTITLSAPSALFGYAFREAEKAHRQLGLRIGKTLESGSR